MYIRRVVVNKPKKLILTIKETKFYKVEVSEERGYDAFPDDILDMVEYINYMKSQPTMYINDEDVTEEIVELVDIKEEK